ncbi:hypothetical protein [Aurantivibrio infirmus]
MNSIDKLVSFVFISMILGGCSSTYQPISNYPLAEFESATVVSNIAQEEIELQIEGGEINLVNAGAYFGWGGAMLGILLDYGRYKLNKHQAEQDVNKFRSVLKAENIATVINSALEFRVRNLSWVSEIGFSTRNLPSREFRETLAASNYTGDVLIVIESGYSFTKNFETIEVVAHYSVFSNELKEESGADSDAGIQLVFNDQPFYSNRVIYQAKVHSTNTMRRLSTEERQEARTIIDEIYQPQLAEVKNRRKREALLGEKAARIRMINNVKVPVEDPNIEGSRWFDNDGVLAREALREGSEEIAKMIEMDLNGKLANLSEHPIIVRDGYKVQLIERDEAAKREILRFYDQPFQGRIVSKSIGSRFVLANASNN